MKRRLWKTCALLMAMLMMLSTAFCATSVWAAKKETITIKTDKGEIRGYRDNDLDIYKGIPYAKPPVGNRRWRAPEPMDSWEGIKDCTKFSASCMQDKQKAEEPYTQEFVIDDSTGYSEDCLYLNVWSKNDHKKKKPVIVYVHGGAFVSGGSSCEAYKGDGLAGKDAVYISLNYRLGPFGFYAHPELSKESPDGVSGNYGLQDILLALQWVKKNAEVFGGDSSNVTLIGQSAGACLTELAAISPKAKGLVQKAVILSYPQYSFQNFTLSLAETLGKVSAGDTSVEELRKIPDTELIEKLGSFWMPVKDGLFVPKNTKEAYLDGTANDIPVIYSSVPGDIAFSLFGVTGHSMKEKVMALSVIPGLLDKPNEITDQERNTLMTDYLCSAAAREKTMRSKTYIVYFSHVLPGPKSAENGAFHTSDVPYWLDNLVSSRNGYWSTEDKKLADLMSDYIISFAKTGNPNSRGSVHWNPYSGTFTFLSIEGADKIGMLSVDDQSYWENTVRERVEN